MNSHGQPKSQLQYSTYLPSILQFLLAMFPLPVRLPLFLIPARGKLAGFWVTPQETFEHGSPNWAAADSCTVRQPDGEFAVFARFAVNADAAAVLLRDDIVAHRQAEARALTRRLGGEERLEQPVLD